jgi:dephospho-CoA kinase
MVIGLTGGIGSGKSAVESLWQSVGVPVLDTDQVSRSLTAAGGAAMPKVRALFGEAYVDNSGAMNRAKMRELIFTDIAARHQLEALLHGMIRENVELWLAQQQQALPVKVRQCSSLTHPIIVLAVPLLLERGSLLPHIQRTVVVDCLESTQVTRVMQRSQLSAQAVDAVMRTQLRRVARLARADFVINNEGTLVDLKASALHCLQKLEGMR